MTGRPGRALAAFVLVLALVACKHKPKDVIPFETACLSNAACAAGQYCAFTPGLCGRGPVPGACRAKPASCDAVHAPVCGCDGNIYDSDCLARAGGVDLAVMGGCTTVLADWAPCGPRYCDVRTSYCEIYLSDVFEIPTTYTCRALPAACRPASDGSAAPTCACFPAETPCHAFCGPLPTGGLTGFHLTCQGVQYPDDPDHRVKTSP